MEGQRSIAVVKQEIEELKSKVTSDIDVADELAYTDAQIERLLKRLPVVEYDAATNVVLKLIDYKESKRRLTKVRGTTMMRANALKTDKRLTAQKDREAWTNEQPEVEQAEIAVINAEATYKIAEYRLQMLENLYNSVKKMVAMRIQQNQVQDHYNG